MATTAKLPGLESVRRLAPSRATLKQDAVAGLTSAIGAIEAHTHPFARAMHTSGEECMRALTDATVIGAAAIADGTARTLCMPKKPRLLSWPHQACG